MRNKKTITEAPAMGKRLSENPEYWSSSRYYRGKIERFFLFFLWLVGNGLKYMYIWHIDT